MTEEQKGVLAKDRTILANERTLLAYIRTSLTLFVAGVTFVRFFGEVTFTVLGILFVFGSVFIMFVGLQRFKKEDFQIKKETS